ncbi:hypothetical protein MRX96_007176 [Rhipicephalus microplus]
MVKKRRKAQTNNFKAHLLASSVNEERVGSPADAVDASLMASPACDVPKSEASPAHPSLELADEHCAHRDSTTAMLSASTDGEGIAEVPETVNEELGLVGPPANNASQSSGRVHRDTILLTESELQRLTVLAWQDLGRGLLLSENPHLRARFQIVHRRRDERRKVLAWRGRALSGYRLPSDDLGHGLLLSENPHLRARFQIVHRRRDERRKVPGLARTSPVWLPATERRFVHSALNPCCCYVVATPDIYPTTITSSQGLNQPQPPGPQAPPLRQLTSSVRCRFMYFVCMLSKYNCSVVC